MTCGAAASLTISLSAICNAGDEVITFAPYFTAVQSLCRDGRGKPYRPCRPTPTRSRSIFPHWKARFRRKLPPCSFNSPNNPSGVVYGRETVEKLAALLAEKSAEYGHTIYLISDEPYRELVYGGVEVPYLPAYYKDTLVCYSYSKSLSLPGERIGYIFVSPQAKDAGELYLAVCGAGRALGYVCAPSLFQKVIARCQGMTSDVSPS